MMKDSVCVNESLKIPLGRNRMLFIYAQSYNGRTVQINIYYFSGLPYSSAVDSTTEKFSLCVEFSI